MKAKNLNKLAVLAIIGLVQAGVAASHPSNRGLLNQQGPQTRHLEKSKLQDKKTERNSKGISEKTLGRFSALLKDVPGSVKGKATNVVIHVNGESGFLEKLRLIESAQPGDRLDLGYFIYEKDFSSSYLTMKILEKASQGVKTRIIVDHFMAEAFSEFYQFLASQSNIEVFRFRPASPQFMDFLKNDLKISDNEGFVKGMAMLNKEMMLGALMSSPLLAPPLQLLLKMQAAKNAGAPENSADSPQALQLMGLQLVHQVFAHLQQAVKESGSAATTLSHYQKTAQLFESHMLEFTRRLHHKFMIKATPTVTEMQAGGRNLSDEYHLTQGDALLENRSYPFFDLEVSATMKGEQAADLQKTVESLLARSSLLQRVEGMPENAQAKVLGELQAKANTFEEALPRVIANAQKGRIEVPLEEVDFVYSENVARARASGKKINQAWSSTFKMAKKRITIISAYSHFTKERVEAIQEALDANLEVHVYTNSFTSTDMNMVNLVTYMKLAAWKKQFGDNFKLFELQLGEGQGSLHAKAIVIDDTILGIGSANMDPRSEKLDTNNVMFFDVSQTPEVAQQTRAAFIGGEGSLFKLPWLEVSAEYAEGALKVAAAKNPRLLQFLRLPFVIDQL